MKSAFCRLMLIMKLLKGPWDILLPFSNESKFVMCCWWCKGAEFLPLRSKKIFQVKV
jgi:hypothetical protein